MDRQIPSQNGSAPADGSAKPRCKAVLSPRPSRVARGDLGCTYPADESGFCKIHREAKVGVLQVNDGRSVGPNHAKTILAKYGRTRLEVSPVNALLSLIYEAAGNVEFLREKVNELQSMVVPGKTTREEVATYVQLYDQERDRLHKYTSDALRIGLEQRQVKLYELQARTIAEVIRRIVDVLELTPEQKVAAFQTAAAELRTFAAKGDNLWSGPYANGGRETTVVDARSDGMGSAA